MDIQLNDNLTLRQIKLSDAQDIFHAIDTQREYLGEWLPFVTFTRKVSDTRQFIRSIIEAPESQFEYVFTIRKQAVFVGIIGFKDTDHQNKKTEIGYWLSENYQKQGIVTKSVEALCHFAFNTLNINRIQIKCALGNIPSKNIPKRLGFTLEGIERDGELLADNTFTNLEVYSILKSEHYALA